MQFCLQKHYDKYCVEVYEAQSAYPTQSTCVYVFFFLLNLRQYWRHNQGLSWKCAQIYPAGDKSQRYN